jgi:hypothetical protein
MTVIEDKNQFSHEEQEELKADIKEIKKGAGVGVSGGRQLRGGLP